MAAILSKGRWVKNELFLMMQISYAVTQKRIFVDMKIEIFIGVKENRVRISKE